MAQFKLHTGNNKHVLKTFDDNSVDSIITDPPYEYGFMGKSWDSTGIAYDVELWKECLRVVKPGGYIMAFGSSRTHHRLMVAIEDAGFEIRDTVCWVFGSGFPKSLNIGKAVDKLQGNEREEYLAPIAKPDSDCWGIPNNNSTGKVKNPSSYNIKTENISVPGGMRRHTKGTSEFEGWGTALKPAVEYICMARKPLSEKTVAENCLKWGTGGINIDESRVEITDLKNEPGYRPNAKNHTFNSDHSTSYKMHSNEGKHRANADEGYHNSKGRFPANLITDGSEEVRECFPETKSGATKSTQSHNGESIFGNSGYRGDFEASSGNASRFFKSIIYQAKPSKAERNRGCEAVFNLFEQSEGLEKKENAGSYEFRADGSLDGKPTSPKENFHPTVKPIALMEYLINMVTPKGGIVLDPFNGSGSTGCAAVKNGFEYIGIDITPEYITISNKRIKSYI